MADVFTPEQRSQVMKKVRSYGNKTTELKLVALLGQMGITGWRRHYPVKGRPDFVFLKDRIAVFVDGCFWHGHDCRNTVPKDNADYWAKKRAKNIRHDQEITAWFEKRNWTVFRIWECELKNKNLPAMELRLKQLFKTK